MNTATTSIRLNTLRRVLPIAAAIGSLAVMSARADAHSHDEITIFAPVAKTVGRDDATGAPIQDVSVTAQVATDPEALTTRAGARRLQHDVVLAARKACMDADPLTPDDGACVHSAVAAARPQVHAAIVEARSGLYG